MSESRNLREKIKEMVSRRREDSNQRRREVEARMARFEQRERRFREAARHIYKDIIEPRLKLLPEQFQDAAYEPSPDGDHGAVMLNRELRYAAAVSLKMGLVLDRESGKAAVTYHMRIIPVLFQYPAEDSFPFDLDAPDDGRITCWVEEKILQGVENYLKLCGVPGYQKENLVIDPVCGMTINRLEAARNSEYEGRTHYFCVPSCRERFLENPGKYVK